MRTRVDLDLDELSTIITGGTIEMLLGEATVHLGYHGPTVSLVSHKRTVGKRSRKRKGKYHCDEHDMTFRTPQALGAHRRITHGKTKAA